jgi:hypothetical protein
MPISVAPSLQSYAHSVNVYYRLFVDLWGVIDCPSNLPPIDTSCERIHLFVYSICRFWAAYILSSSTYTGQTFTFQLMRGERFRSRFANWLHKRVSCSLMTTDIIVMHNMPFVNILNYLYLIVPFSYADHVHQHPQKSPRLVIISPIFAHHHPSPISKDWVWQCLKWMVCLIGSIYCTCLVGTVNKYFSLAIYKINPTIQQSYNTTKLEQILSLIEPIVCSIANYH